MHESVVVPGFFFFFFFLKMVIKKHKSYKILLKKKELHILTKTHTHTQIYKVLQFSFTNCLILKSLNYSLIINAKSYVSFIFFYFFLFFEKQDESY